MSQVSYPVYRVGLEKPEIKDGVIYYHYKLEKDDKVDTVIKIVDDKSVEGDTLGKRRLSLLKDGMPLAKIGMAIFFLGDLVKIAKPKMWFIDSKGTLFNYKKSNKAKLVFKRIVRKIPIPTGGTILEVEGIPSRFKCLHKPLNEENYAGILMLNGMSPILYGLYDRKYDSTWRMI